MSPDRSASAGKTAPVQVRVEEAPLLEDGWLEVGRRNRTVVTRTVSFPLSFFEALFDAVWFRSGQQIPPSSGYSRGSSGRHLGRRDRRTR
jgi:hypothetical protein